jgi:peptide deformylase
MSKTNLQKNSKLGDKIVVKGHPALSTRAREIRPDEIGKPYLNGVIKLMKDQLATQDDGVAIAAPQVGESIRLFVVSPNSFHGNQTDKQTVFINPKLLKLPKTESTC